MPRESGLVMLMPSGEHLVSLPLGSELELSRGATAGTTNYDSAYSPAVLPLHELLTCFLLTGNIIDSSSLVRCVQCLALPSHISVAPLSSRHAKKGMTCRGGLRGEKCGLK